MFKAYLKVDVVLHLLHKMNHLRREQMTLMQNGRQICQQKKKKKVRNNSKSHSSTSSSIGDMFILITIHIVQ